MRKVHSMLVISIGLALVCALAWGATEEQDQPSPEKVAALFSAVRTRDVEKVKSLLESGVSANSLFGDLDSSILKLADGGQPSASRSFRPLHALGLPPTQIHDEMKLNHLDANTECRCGRCFAPEFAIVSCLVRHGADLVAVDALDEEPFHIAINQGNDSVARLLMAVSECQASGPSIAARIHLDTCVPRVPLTLDLFLCLKGSSVTEKQLNSAFTIAILCGDWESCGVIHRHARHLHPDPVLLDQIRPREGKGGKQAGTPIPAEPH